MVINVNATLLTEVNENQVILEQINFTSNTGTKKSIPASVGNPRLGDFTLRDFKNLVTSFAIIMF